MKYLQSLQLEVMVALMGVCFVVAFFIAKILIHQPYNLSYS